ncbi:MAG: ROK family protein [Pyrinomonadaceae bacterium]
MEKVVLAVDLGGTNLRMAAVNENGQISYRAKCATPRDADGPEIVRSIDSLAQDFLATAEGARASRTALGLAAAATINGRDGILTKAPNMPSLNGFEMRSALAERLKIPVILENDATAAAIGENWLGASAGYSNSICVTLGTGVGGGIIIEGRPLRGPDGTAGEIGHICVEPLGRECGCGSRGCVEQYASASAMVRMARELLPDFPGSSLHGNCDITSLDLYEAGKSGDELALEVFRSMGSYLGIALAGLINVLNPEVIVIGGGAASGWDLFINQLQDVVQKRSFREPAERAKLMRSGLGDDSGILGAARLALSSNL